jgi:hypothetical protein
MAAVSSSLASLLSGRERGGRVVTVRPSVVHLEVAREPAHRSAVAGHSQAAVPRATASMPMVLALLGTGAVRLPLGLLLAPGERGLLASARVGAPAVVGGGRVDVGGTTVRVTRWWDPSLPRRSGPPRLDAVDRLDALLRVQAAGLPDAVTGPAGRLGLALAGEGRAALRDAVDGLLGLGPGLTPAGDDVLVGALAGVLAAAPAAEPMMENRPGAGPAALAEVVREVLERDPGRTTALSAALLDQALRGFALPELSALLRAVDASPDGRLRRAAEALVAVGGSSGTALAHGLLLGLRSTAAPAGRAA